MKKAEFIKPSKREKKKDFKKEGEKLVGKAEWKCATRRRLKSAAKFPSHISYFHIRQHILRGSSVVRLIVRNVGARHGYE